MGFDIICVIVWNGMGWDGIELLIKGRIAGTKYTKGMVT